MNGSFDDVRIYNRAITTDEISALYNMGGTGLLSWWKMDEGTGSLLGDSSGNNYTARLVGSPVWTSGKLGKALTFTGSNYATTSLNTAPSALTVSLWYNKPSYNNNDSILMEHSANFNVENGSFLIDPDSGGSCSGYYSVAVLGNTGYNVKCYTRPSAGVWHHLAFMLDKRNAAANEVNMYVDGVLQTAVSQPNVADNTNTFSDRTIYLMSYGGTAFFATGTIDDLRIYNRVLSVGEVQALSALKSVSVKGR
jgi:hypothetical protein